MKCAPFISSLQRILAAARWRGSQVSMKCLNHLIDRPSITQGCTWIVVSLCLCLSIIGAVAESEHAGLSHWQEFCDCSAKGHSDDPGPQHTVGLGERAGWAVRRLPVGQRQMENRCEFHCLFFFFFLNSFHIFTTFKCPHNDVSFVWIWYWLYSYILLQKNSIFDFLILSECNHPWWFSREHPQWADDRGSYSQRQEFPLAHCRWRRHDCKNIKWAHLRPACIRSRSPFLEFQRIISRHYQNVMIF